MDRSIEREVLLQNIALFYQGTHKPDDKLISNYINSVGYTGESLLGIQTRVRNDYIKDQKKGELRIAPYPNFLAIDTPDKDGKYQNIFTMSDGIKIYIPIDKPSRIYKVSTSIINFIKKKKIPVQFKLQNNHVKDSLTLKCLNKDDASLLIEYINKKFKNDISTDNPFIPSIEGINTCVDGSLSYNRVLARLLDNYLFDKKINGSLDTVSCAEFSEFIGCQIEILQGAKWHYSFLLYGIKDKRMFQDFILIAKMIKNNISSELFLNDLEAYQKMKRFKPGDKYEYDHSEKREINKKALRQLLIYLKNYLEYDETINNSIEHLHKVMMDYIDRDNIAAFTRYGRIRHIIEKYYPRDIFEEYIKEIGYDTLVNAALETKLKYGDDQLKAALSELMSKGKLTDFTNEKGYRSELGFIIPTELLVRMLNSHKNQENNLYEEIININPKKSGRK